MKELRDADRGKWFVLPRGTPGQFLGEGARQMRRFRVQDDAFGERIIELGKGDVRELTTFPAVLAENWGGEAARYFTDNDERTARGREAQQAAPAKRRDLGAIETLTMPELEKIGESFAKDAEVGPDRWDETVVSVGGPLWTAGMGPCITVAATGMTVEQVPRRVIVLHHSFSNYPAKNREIGHSIIEEMETKVATATGQPLAKLQGLKFYVVGGDRSSAEKMRLLVTLLLFRRYDIAGVADTTSPVDAGASKAVLINTDGRVQWAKQDQPSSPAPQEVADDDDLPTFAAAGRGRGGGMPSFAPAGGGRSTTFTSARNLGGSSGTGRGDGK